MGGDRQPRRDQHALKDIIDLEELARTESFDGATVQNAIRRTFERRQTPLDLNAAALTTAYREDRERQSMWAAARKRLQRPDAPERFSDAMTRVLEFVEPPFRAAAVGDAFIARWDSVGRRWR